TTCPNCRKATATSSIAPTASAAKRPPACSLMPATRTSSASQAASPPLTQPQCQNESKDKQAGAEDDDEPVAPADVRRGARIGDHLAGEHAHLVRRQPGGDFTACIDDAGDAAVGGGGHVATGFASSQLRHLELLRQRDAGAEPAVVGGVEDEVGLGELRRDQPAEGDLIAQRNGRLPLADLER